MMDRPSAKAFHVGMIASPHPHAAMHLRTLDVLPPVARVSVCGVEGQDPAALTREMAKAHVVPSVQELLSESDLDAVLVCVRNDRCPDVLASVIDAGKPALFEKPGALRAEELRRVAAAARERHLTLGTALQWRGHPVVQEARGAVHDGALGRVMAVEARMVTSQVRYRDPGHWLFRRSTAGSGILSWLGCHYLDALCFVLDDAVVEVSAMVGQQNPEPIEVEDTACLVLRFAGGALGTLHAGYLLAGSASGYAGGAYDTFLGFRGTAGFLRLPLSEGMSYTLFSEAPGWRAGGRRERRFDLPASLAYGGAPGEEFMLQFLTAAREGRPALAPPEAAIHVLEVVEAALESVASGRTVRVGT